MIKLKPGDVVKTIHVDMKDEIVGKVELIETKESLYMTDVNGESEIVEFVTIKIIYSPISCLCGSLQTFESYFLQLI